MKTIILQDLTDLEQKFLHAVHIMLKERKYENRWNDHHDTQDKQQREKWSAERNKFLDSLVLNQNDHNRVQELKIEINKT
jgi:hypothetical protein